MDYYKLFDSKQLFTMVFTEIFLMSQPVILVAEDNDSVRMQIVTFLKSAYFSVIEATDGKEAWQLLRRKQLIW